MELPIYNITLTDIKQGVHKISLVESPAIEEEWIAFSEDETDFKLASEVEQKLIGALLVPDKKIFRNHPTKGKFYIVFSKEVIEEIVSRFNSNGLNNEFNVEHSTDIDGVVLSENWIVKDSNHDKSKAYGLDYPEGTWVGLAKVEERQKWDAIKNNLNGFSVELLTKIVESNLSFEEEETPTDEEMVEWLSDKGELESDYMDSDEWELVEEEEEEFDFAIESKPKEPSKFDNENFITRYKYIGGRPIKTTRYFCREMITTHKGMIFRHEDINQMSFRRENKEFAQKKSYSIFRFKGSYGCRHRWKKLLFKKTKAKSDKKPPNPKGYSEARKLNKDIKLSKQINMELKIKFEAQAELTDGKMIFTPTGFKEGAVVYSGENEEGTLLASGEYELPSGEIMVVGEEGVVSEIKPKAEEGKVEEELEGEEAPKAEGDSEAMKVMAEEVAKLMSRVDELEAKIASTEGEEAKTEDFSKQIDEAVKVALSKIDGGEFKTDKTDEEFELSHQDSGVIGNLKKTYNQIKNK